MALIKSISGIRGTIGGVPGEGLSPLDVVKFTSAYGLWIKKNTQAEKTTIIVGRDARISGEMVNHFVLASLASVGIHTIDLGMATTPTVELAVTDKKAQGGIIITASHNPKQWNALKLLNEKGEFLSASDGDELLAIADAGDFMFSEVDVLGQFENDFSYDQTHIDHVLALPLVDVDAIMAANFTVAIDAVNSVGATIIPDLLAQLGVAKVIELYCEPNGHFPHNPEPLPGNLRDLSQAVTENEAHLGFAVDPDVDRLAIVNEDGSMFGEEYTLVAVADYVLSNTKGNTVSNLSSTRALRDVTEKHGGQYFASAVGEVNVVEKMKAKNAIIGGEGNGGIIYPETHYGRDALVGIALFLTYLAKEKKSCSKLRASFPNYVISKNKIALTPDLDVDAVLTEVEQKYANTDGVELSTIDGVKLDFAHGWVHLRKSNTEPIIRIYAESNSEKEAEDLAKSIMNLIDTIVSR